MPPSFIHDWFARAAGRYELSLSHSACQTLYVHDLLDNEGLRAFAEISLAYGAFDGLLELRTLIAGQYTTIAPSQVLTLNGPSEAIYSFMRATLWPGSRVVVPAPVFQPLRAVAELIGCEITPWQATDARRCTFNVDDLEALCDRSTDLIIINFPHNPSGQMLSTGELDRIVQIAKSADALLLSDESFRLLELPTCTTLPAVCDLYDRGISLAGLSKPFGLGGLRIGWIASRHPQLCQAAKQYRYNTSEMTNTPGEWLACRALQQADVILARNRSIIADNLERLESFAARHASILRLFRPQAGTMAIMEQRTDLSSTDFCERLLSEEKLFLIPGRSLQMPDDVLRFGLGMPDLYQGLVRLDNFLQRFTAAIEKPTC